MAPDAYTLSALIMACQACNYWEEAMEVAARFKADHEVLLTTRACNALIATLGKAGRWQYAMQVFVHLSPARRSSHALIFQHCELGFLLESLGKDNSVLKPLLARLMCKA